DAEAVRRGLTAGPVSKGLYLHSLATAILLRLPPSTSGPGHSPFKAVARVRIPPGASADPGGCANPDSSMVRCAREGTFGRMVPPSVPPQDLGLGCFVTPRLFIFVGAVMRPGLYEVPQLRDGGSSRFVAGDRAGDHRQALIPTDCGTRDSRPIASL